MRVLGGLRDKEIFNNLILRSMSKVNLVAVNSANVRVDNSVVADSVYNIVQSMEVRGKDVVNISEGTIKQGEVVKANYQRWGDNNLNIQFQTSDVAEMCDIINAINGFIGDCEVAVANEELTINN